MTMNKTSFVNKGWVNETEISLQPENTVRDILNFRVVSNDQNTYSAEVVQGNDVTFKLADNYRPIGGSIQGNILCIFSSNDSSEDGGNGEIGVVYYNVATLTGSYTPIYNHPDLLFSQQFMIGKEARIQKENDKIERIYWTDNFNNIRALNIVNRDINTAINPSANIASGSLVVGEQYMVVQGAIDHNGTSYGPNVSYPSTSQTTFTAVNANYTVLSGPTIVVKYTPNVATLDVVPKKALGNIKFTGWIPGGQLKCGEYQIAYQLETSDGFLTNWSYLSQATHVTVEIPGDQAISYARYVGHVSATSVNKSLKFKIEGVDTNFFKLRAAYVYTGTYNTPSPPIVFWEAEIGGSSTQDIILSGNENIQQLTLADLELQYNDFDTAKTITTLKNRLFAGNIKAGFDFDWTPETAKIKLIEYLSPSDALAYPGPAESIPAGFSIHGQNQVKDSGNTFLYKDQWYQVQGTGSISYAANTYNVGDVFQAYGFPFRGFTVLSGSPKVIAVLRIQKYTGTFDIIPIENDWTDSKGQMADFYLRSRMRGETYREGIMLWKKRGQPTFVKWLGDRPIPPQYAVASDIDPITGQPIGFDMRISEPELWNGTISMHTSLRHIGISIDDLDFNSLCTNMGITINDLPKYFDGFSIVRAPRDKQILAQGLWYPMMVDGNNTVPMITDSADDALNRSGARRPNIYQFYSPELQFQFNNEAQSPTAGDYLAVADYIGPDGSFTSVNPRGQLDTNNFHFYNKMYTQYNQSSGNDFPKTSTVNIIPSRCAFADTGNSGFILDVNTPSIITDNKTSYPATGSNRNTIGTRTMFMTIDLNESSSPGVNGWPLDAYAGSNRNNVKGLINFVRPKGNLYGGTSDSAKANTLYVYAGHYQAFDSGFMAHLNSTSGGKAVGAARDIWVFGGDIFVQMYSMQRTMKDNSSSDPQISCADVFPVESTINANLREGVFFNKDRNKEGSDNSAGINYPTTPEAYVVNTAYCSTEDTANYIQYPSKPIGFISASRFEHRVIYSLFKTDGEIIDNYRIFLPLNYIDVEGWSGEINNVRSKSGRLFYWQNQAFGYIPVLERELSTGVMGQPVTLGTGGVAQRFDELKNFYGNQHKHGLAESETDFYWFDARRKAFCRVSTGGDIAELSIQNGLRSYLKNNIIGDVLLFDNPLTGKGIYAEFNAMYKEVVMSFKGVTGGDICIGYDTINRQFSSKFSYKPPIMFDFYDHLITPTPELAPVIVGNTDYKISDVVSQGQKNYVCIKDYTSQPTPTQPTFDPAHWLLINDISQMWIHNLEGVSQAAFLYGKVDDAYITKVMNDNYSIPKVIDNIKQNSGLDFWTSIIYNNSTEVFSDLNIDVLINQDFRNIDKSWYYNLPFSDTEGDRNNDGWLQGKFIKDNRLVVGGIPNPIVSKNEIVKLVSLEYTYRKIY